MRVCCCETKQDHEKHDTKPLLARPIVVSAEVSLFKALAQFMSCRPCNGACINLERPGLGIQILETLNQPDRTHSLKKC